KPEHVISVFRSPIPQKYEGLENLLASLQGFATLHCAKFFYPVLSHFLLALLTRTSYSLRRGMEIFLSCARHDEGNSFSLWNALAIQSSQPPNQNFIFYW
ncbi:MAG: hypothetical protein AAB354_01470, partial [candidate division KSB1 bacterium]